MRFKAQIQNITTFNKFVASLASIGPIAWVRLDEEHARFTVMPEQGTQVWAVLAIDTIFGHEYSIQSNADNTINLEVPLGSLQRALKSALQAHSASIRLTKKDGRPILSITIHRTTGPSASLAGNAPVGDTDDFGGVPVPLQWGTSDRETVITQDVPIRILSQATVEGLHEPRCRDPDVHILLPPLAQLKAASDRFTKLALSTPFTGPGPRLELAANMHGCLRLRVAADAIDIKSVWTGLVNPELDPGEVEGGEGGVEGHPSTRMRGLGDPLGRREEGWATVRIDGRDWGKVMSVGRLGGRVIACFCHESALILYVYMPDDEGREDSVLTYYISSYSI
ncbi:Hus1-like protein [Eremomyces bilateralis CBS 781.70]|uniref:Checkpoint protein n=1 Tax=Eremomyces bilateralis CBS 781.70 TaxID=1392243 RepID=A0A6G1FZ98_9PEZI|nr:Hus1-like protein [Eremomyces bilateralis CBS 781.70]KAF1811042.1 Hus1-like protein [Eremomyces bilateralis CBS 781.70]